MKRSILALLALLLVPAATPAQAQSQDQFVGAFSGQWQVYDKRLGTGSDTCGLNLSGLAGAGNTRPLQATNCAPPLNAAAAWSIEGNQLVLYDGQNQPLARLGGNQRRITGSATDGTAIVLERAGGDGSAAMLQAAYNASGCYFVGYTQGCARPGDLGLPGPGPDGRIRIELQANLNAHTEPRVDAESIGTVQRGTCVVADSCVMASDGPWCKATFDGAAGWLRKFSLRQNRWPVVTYANSCGTP